ncbi:DUF433 domain-containing protein [Candidatus Berkelbacteria bacterium]|nr:DUF433 domain-containing protein [Candidatus Berkelbacteria bacterium]
MKKHKFIIKDKLVMGGEPVIIGTRIPAERLARLIEQGFTPQNLKRDFPQVDSKVIKGAVKEITELAVGALKAV